MNKWTLLLLFLIGINYSYSEEFFLKTSKKEIYESSFSQLNTSLNNSEDLTTSTSELIFESSTLSFFNAVLDESIVKSGKKLEFEKEGEEIFEDNQNKIKYSDKDLKRIREYAEPLIAFASQKELSAEEYYKQKIKNSEYEKIHPNIDQWGKDAEKLKDRESLEALKEMSNIKNSEDMQKYSKKVYKEEKGGKARLAFKESLINQIVNHFKINENTVKLFTEKEKVVISPKTDQESIKKGIASELLRYSIYSKIKDEVISNKPAILSQYKDFLNRDILRIEKCIKNAGINPEEVKNYVFSEEMLK